MRFIFLALTALGAAASAAANPTDPKGNIQGLMRADDYPPDALEKGEQGTTQVRLLVGVDGRVKGCEIAASSGSASLDAKTCEVLIERARLTPATDAKGKAVEGTVSQRITWLLQDDPEAMVLSVAVGGWIGCIFQSALPQLLGDRTDEEITTDAQAECKPLEAGIEAAAKASKLQSANFREIMRTMKDASAKQIRHWREEARAASQAAGGDRS